MGFAAVMTILWFLLPCNCASQEKPPLEELLRWLPEGGYQEIEHFDREEFLGTCPRELLQDYILVGNKILPERKPLLPPTLAGHYTSSTVAQVAGLGIKTMEVRLPDGTTRIENRKCAIVVEIDGLKHGGWSPGRWLLIYRFDDLDALVSQAVERGEISPLEERIGKRPLLKFRRSDDDREYYGYASLSQEFLVADDLKDLRRMVRTGLAGTLPVFESMDLTDLIDIASEPAYIWTFRSSVPFYKRLLDYIREHDSGSASLDQLMDLVENDEQYVLDRYSWTADGNRLQMTVTAFGGEEKAEEKYNKMLEGDYGPLGLRSSNAVVAGRQLTFRDHVREIQRARVSGEAGAGLELADNRVIETQVDDKETLIRILEAIKSKLQQEPK